MKLNMTSPKSGFFQKSFILIVIIASILASFQPVGQVIAASADDGFAHGLDDAVHVITEAEDGKIWIGGDFANIDGVPQARLARLNPDGTLDTSFTLWTNGLVRAITIQADGSVLVGGDFTLVSNIARNYLFRILPDGTLDPDFTPNPDSFVNTIDLQSDGEIIVGGQFSSIAGENQAYLARLTSDGTYDPSFTPDIKHNTLVPYIYRIAVQFNDHIVISGLFDEVNNSPRSRITRLDKNGGLDASFLPTASTNELIDALILQPDGKIIISGLFDIVNSSYRPQIARLNPDGSLDNAFNTNVPFPFAQIYALALQSDGKILFGGAFTDLGATPRNRLARLHPNGMLDMDYDPDIGGGDVLALAVESNGTHLVGGRFLTTNSFYAHPYLDRLHPTGEVDDQINPTIQHSDPSITPTIHAIAIQPDRDILIGGQFTTIAPFTHLNIARLKPSGARDPNFTPEINGPVYAIVIQPDEKIIVGGDFDKVNNEDRNNLARLLKNGDLDPDFDPAPNGPVRAIVLQNDGTIWVGGSFTTIDGGGSQGLARLNANGSSNLLISPGAANGDVYTLALESDESLLVGGTFTALRGEPRLGIGRLGPNGGLDMSFDPATDTPTRVHVITVQPDSKILLGGEFGEMDEVARNNIARLESSGAIDDEFNPGANSIVHALALQRDGAIYVGGEFSELDNVSQNSLGKLDQNGDFMTEFDVRTDGEVYALALQPDGKLLLGGTFSNTNEGDWFPRSRPALARLSVDTAAIQSLSFSNNNSELEWTRTGSMPVLSAVDFSVSSDGITFTDLGTATRTSNGWGLTGLNLNVGTNLWVKATGYYATGQGGGSGSFIETTWNVFLLEDTPGSPGFNIYLPLVINP